MADIQLRFHREMLTLSAPIENVLERQGVDINRDMEFMNLVEPDTIQDVMRMELMAGAQCLVANTANMLPARLAGKRMEDRGEELAVAALAVARSLRPQHIIVELAPSLLPFDPSMKSSLLEHKEQYARAARWFEPDAFDAYYLNGFSRIDELRCALMGVRQVSDRPIFATMNVDGEGKNARGESCIDAALIMAEYGASVVGLRSSAPVRALCAAVEHIVAACDLPVMAEMIVTPSRKRMPSYIPGEMYGCPDDLVEAAALLRASGVQFLRAGGKATSAYTGALAITTSGLDAVRPDVQNNE